jgi:ABC-type polysaccharide/polyol phosphate transport system ATPase subunit
MAVIEVKNVNVTYRVLMNKSGSLKELFRDALKAGPIVDYVALQDVSFTVEGRSRCDPWSKRCR